jgi:phosphonate transport system substrate-binding protein
VIGRSEGSVNRPTAIVYDPPVTLSLLLAPSIGTARATARAELLSTALSATLGEETVVTMADNYDELTLRALEGSADLIWAPPSLCARLERTARVMYRCIRRGRGTYRSAIVVRRGEITSLDGLSGTRAAWVDPLSLGGHLLALDYLRSEGHEPRHLFEEQRFVGSYPEALRDVVHERSDVTAISTPDGAAQSIAQAIMLYGGTLQAERLTSIAVTRETPNDALVFSKALDEARTRDLVTRAFGTEAAPKVPSALCMALEADGFEQVDPEEYAPIRRLLEEAVPELPSSA